MTAWNFHRSVRFRGQVDPRDIAARYVVLADHGPLLVLVSEGPALEGDWVVEILIPSLDGWAHLVPIAVHDLHATLDEAQQAWAWERLVR